MAKGKRRNQIEELLSKYFEIDGNVVTIDLSYDSFEDLVDQNFGKDDVNMLSSRLVEDLESAFDMLPRRYKIKLRINLRSLGQFSLKEIKEIIQSNLSLKTYSYGLRAMRKSRLYLSTIGFGLAILAISYSLSRRSLPTIIFDIVNITGTLFIWEAVSSLFLEGRYEKVEASRLLVKLKSIKVCCPDGQQTEFTLIRKKGRQITG